MSDLIRPGDVLHEPLTGSHVTIIELRLDGFVIEQMVEPNKVRSSLHHFHQSWTEKFEIISGSGGYRLDGVNHTAEPGHSFVVNPGTNHIHPWNTGKEPLRFRQSDTFNPPDPTAAVDTFLAFSTLFGLSAEGKANQDGVAKDPLQLMVILDFFRLHGGYTAGLPASVQTMLMAGGAALGRALGYRPWYEKYLPKNIKAR